MSESRWTPEMENYLADNFADERPGSTLTQEYAAMAISEIRRLREEFVTANRKAAQFQADWGPAQLAWRKLGRTEGARAMQEKCAAVADPYGGKCQCDSWRPLSVPCDCGCDLRQSIADHIRSLKPEDV